MNQLKLMIGTDDEAGGEEFAPSGRLHFRAQKEDEVLPYTSFRSFRALVFLSGYIHSKMILRDAITLEVPTFVPAEALMLRLSEKSHGRV